MRTIAIDHGNGYLKASDGRARLLFPSVVGPAITIAFRSKLADQHPEDVVVYSRGRSWFVGELAERHSPNPVPARGQDRDPELLRILTLGALHRLGVPAGERLRLIGGLPISWYHPAAIGALKAALAGRHECGVNGLALDWEVVGSEWYPQPFGALAYEVLRPGGDGSIASRPVGVIDIGYGTTNLARFDALEYLPAASTSIDAGVAAACELLAREVAERYRLDLGPREAQAALRTRVIEVAGHPKPVGELCDRALAVVEDAIAAAVTRLWGNTRQLYRIMLAGGGAHLLGERLLARYPHAQAVPEPQFANVVGFWLYGSL